MHCIALHCIVLYCTVLWLFFASVDVMNKFFEDLTPLEERLINRKYVRYAHLWEKAAGDVFTTFNPSGACSWRQLGRDWLWEETWPCNLYLKITPAISLGCINGTANDTRPMIIITFFGLSKSCSRQFLRTYSARLQEANGYINHGSSVEATMTNKSLSPEGLSCTRVSFARASKPYYCVLCRWQEMGWGFGLKQSDGWM